MAISVECECGKALIVPDKLAGKTIRCKECSETIKVPGGSATGKKQSSRRGVEEEFEDEPAVLRPKTKTARFPETPKKKKKQSRRSSSDTDTDTGLPKWMMPVAILFGLSVGGAGAYLGVKALAGRAQAAAVANAVPEKFSRHTVTDGGISFEYPDGWEVDSGGGTGGRPPWGKFSKNDVSVDIRADLKGAPMADVASLHDTGDSPPELSPQAKVHQFQTEVKYSLEMSDYQEIGPGGFFETPYGTGWLAEFTASEGAFGGKIHGYRLTYAGGVNQYNVVCKCGEKSWKTYQPMFERVLKSISR